MKLAAFLCVWAPAGSYGAAAAACENPPMVTVPDGKTATTDQLRAAQQDVRTYMSAMQEYLACLNTELTTSGEGALAEFKQLMVMRHNAAVSEMESVVALFNAHVVAHRAANPQQPSPTALPPAPTALPPAVN